MPSINRVPIDSPFGMALFNGATDWGRAGPRNTIGSRDWANSNIYLIPEYETLDSNVENELII